MNFEILIAYCSSGSVLIPLIISSIQVRKMDRDLKLVMAVLVLSLASDTIAYILAQNSINTYLVLNIFLITQFICLALIFRNHTKDPLIINVIILTFILFGLINIILFEGPWIFNSASNIAASLILIGLCLSYFYLLMNDLPILHIQQLPMFWISTGILIYYAGNFFLFLVKNYLIYGEFGSHRLMWVLHNLLNITKNILFAIGLWQSYRKPRSSILSSSAP